MREGLAETVVAPCEPHVQSTDDWRSTGVGDFVRFWHPVRGAFFFGDG